ncbi:hypothetical protein I5E72_11130 [Proteus terrae]|uniref:hypothetical protein n=1 Tax=Proteus terrae TaxID=1574161 RepID=UPI0018C60C5E|nr:hypothetical protein [Proteus terrae]MBG5950300.1 hypothetical protein [Proteus terrae]
MKKKLTETKNIELILITAGIIEDLKNPLIYNNPKNIKKLLNRNGVNEIMEHARIYKKLQIKHNNFYSD